MKTSAALIPIAPALGAAVLVSGRVSQAAPIAIKTCQNITTPGSYVLTRNLLRDGNCLVITATSVAKRSERVGGCADSGAPRGCRSARLGSLHTLSASAARGNPNRGPRVMGRVADYGCRASRLGRLRDYAKDKG